VSTRLEISAASEWRAHWPIVLAAAAGYAVASIISYSSSLFIEPLQSEFGWSRAQIMSGHSIAALAGAIFAPFTGLAVDKFGPRRFGIFAIVAMCLATASFGLAGPDIDMWRALWLPASVAIVLIQPSVWTAAVTSVFLAGRGFALAVTLCGGSVASIVTPQVTNFLIQNYGWRSAFAGLGAFWAIVALPLVYYCFSSALDLERASSGSKTTARATPRESIWKSGVLTRRFVQLLIAGVGIAAVVVTLVVSLVPVLSANGLIRAQAVNIASLVGISAIAGRLSIGMLLDRWNGRFLAAFAVSMPIGAILLLIYNTGSSAAATVAVLILGISFGAELDIIAYLTSRYFKIAHFGLLFGTIAGFIGLAAGNGPVAISAVYDSTQSYLPALWAMIPICLASALLFVLLGPYPDTGIQAAETRSL
jgi:predicted MFS family arabinose efflux permease